MKIDDILIKIKTLTGTTSSELIIVSIIFLGLIIGNIVSAFNNNSFRESKINPEVFRILDSLALEAQKTYTGTDEANNPLIVQDSNLSNENLNSDTLVLSNQNTQQKSSKKDRLVGVLINLNSASKVELMKLPNVGEKTAISIIEYRKKQAFEKISDIKKIKWIGEKKFESMKEFIEVR
jgi:competence protein ComEA